MTPRRIGPVLTAGALGAATVLLVRRLASEYARTDTLTGRAVAAMYATYAGYLSALAWGCGRRVWPVLLPPGVARVVGGAAAGAGCGLALAGAAPFGPGAQLSGVEPGALHIRGVYRYTRNPQYLGLSLAATGLAVATRSGFAGLVAAGMWCTYRWWILVEEAHLGRVFGEAYLRYRAEVRRWLGRRGATAAPGRSRRGPAPA